MYDRTLRLAFSSEGSYSPIVQPMSHLVILFAIYPYVSQPMAAAPVARVIKSSPAGCLRFFMYRDLFGSH
jgi:hypothetical protein